MPKINQEAAFTRTRVIFRADGNSQIGLGHITRSLALASILKNHFDCLFAIQEPTSVIINDIISNGATYLDLPATTNYLSEANYLKDNHIQEGDILVLDGYNFNLEYQQTVKIPGKSLVCIDDIKAYDFVADAIINTAGGITADQYHGLPETKFYLGPNYALLRPPFIKAAKQTREITEIKRIFLNMGGADPDNYTCQIISSILLKYPDLFLEVVIGSAYKHQHELQNLVFENTLINIHKNLDAEKMCALMQTCDAAILPPSSVSYEWCSVNGPLFLYQIADNQKFINQFLLENKLALPFDHFTQFLKNPEKENLIAEQIKNQRYWFNGQNAQNLLAIFLELAYHKNLKIRKADLTDMERLFNWANDPEVRRNSFNSEPISWEVHQIWFKNKLRDPNCLFGIAEVNKIPAGMIRFDITEQAATISYLLDQNFRGKGLGAIILEKGLAFLQEHQPEVIKAIGHIQETNLVSVKAFQKNNFLEIKNTNSPSLVFEKSLK